MTRSILRAFVVSAIVLGSLEAVDAQRIDPGARDVLAYRLTLDVAAKLRQVMLALDGYRAPSPEAVRPDIAMVTVLSMTMPYGGAFTDGQARDTAATLDRGHHELSIALGRVGLTSREYVLAWMTLLAAHSPVAAKRGGRTLDTGVAPENLAFVERHWADVDRFVGEFGQRLQRARGGG